MYNSVKSELERRGSGMEAIQQLAIPLVVIAVGNRRPADDIIRVIVLADFGGELGVAMFGFEQGHGGNVR